MNLDLIAKVLGIFTAIKGQLGDKKTETLILILLGFDVLSKFIGL